MMQRYILQAKPRNYLPFKNYKALKICISVYSKCINIRKVNNLLVCKQFMTVPFGALRRKSTAMENTQKNYGTTLNEQCRKAYV